MFSYCYIPPYVSAAKHFQIDINFSTCIQVRITSMRFKIALPSISEMSSNKQLCFCSKFKIPVVHAIIFMHYMCVQSKGDGYCIPLRNFVIVIGHTIGHTRKPLRKILPVTFSLLLTNNTSPQLLYFRCTELCSSYEAFLFDLG